MKRFAANASLVLASLLVALIIIEMVLRVADFSHPLGSTYDPFTGYGWRANLNGWAYTESVERVRSDRFALRTFDDQERALAHARTMKKPDGVMRVAFLGDSFTQSIHVACTESFPYQVEKHLNACPNIDARVEVLNFAISGFSNVQELMAFRHRARNSNRTSSFLCSILPTISGIIIESWKDIRLLPTRSFETASSISI